MVKFTISLNEQHKTIKIVTSTLLSNKDLNVQKFPNVNNMNVFFRFNKPKFSINFHNIF